MGRQWSHRKRQVKSSKDQEERHHSCGEGWRSSSIRRPMKARQSKTKSLEMADGLYQVLVSNKEEWQKLKKEVPSPDEVQQE